MVKELTSATASLELTCGSRRMEIVEASLLENGTNITDILCDYLLQNYTFFCEDDPPNSSRDLHQIIRILLYCLIFLLSVLGNILVITVLIRNKRMRTVTNTFLLSLAVSDLMLCLFCMPFTLIPNLLKDFIFGSAVCKTATYFMGISVSVSTFNLVAISLERYSAICKPLQSRVWQTKSHALKVIAATWYTFLLLILFLIPGIIMMVAYGLISLELYRGIKFDASQRKSSRERKISTSSAKYEDGDGCYLQKSKRKRKVPLQQLSVLSNSKIDRARSSSSSANLMAKKLVIRMLMVIVILFFLCWTPIFSVNAWRAFDTTSADLHLSGAPISFIHLLSYTSACVNPIIYCFMNKRFRTGFLATFTCCAKQKPPAIKDVGDEEEGKTTRASLSKYSYTHMNISAPP
ncbi:cholecystokinin receptor type A isoform X2 [Anas platyrhynchos]|uniref:cholecystokinin receptor type A isoform X2 n=1 Tax=Anas platyrhynchos TaxID=8839 RepID=UPI0018D6768F|nr:cholecystokinin receptor type A isoform X2 [Anas platyrhynchos]